MKEFKKIVEVGGLRGQLAEYALELVVEYFRLCSECNKYHEMAEGSANDGDRRRRQEASHDAYARAELLEAVVTRLMDLVAA